MGISRASHTQYAYIWNPPPPPPPGLSMNLKTYIHDERVCGTKTKSTIHDFTSLHFISECGMSRSEEAHNLKIRMVAWDLPWTPACVPLPIEAPFSKMTCGKE